MGLIDSLNIAVRGMQVEQNSIRTTSHNIANADTEGYSRQRVERASGRPFLTDRGALGTGVEQTSVTRMNDAVIDRQLQVERSNRGSADVQANALRQIEEVVNEQNGAGIGAALSKLYASFSDLSNNPAGSTERQAAVIAADTFAGALHQADDQIRSIQRDTNRGIVTEIDNVNALAANVAQLNRSISQAEVRAPANDLRDQRDQLLRDLSDRLDVTSIEQDDGQLLLFIDGGLALVQGETANQLVAVADPMNPFDASNVQVHFDGGGNRLDVTDTLSGGSLGGLLAVRDSAAVDAIRGLDTIAYNVATQINGVHAAGVGLDGSVGDFFVQPSAVEDAAGSLQVEASLRSNLDAVAAGFGTSPGDNRNALDLAALRGTRTALFMPGDPPGPPSGPTRSLLDEVSAFSAGFGQRSSSMQAALTQSERVLETIQNRRDEMVGVSIDEEVANLIRLQTAFQANARVLGTVRDLLDDFMSLI